MFDVVFVHGLTGDPYGTWTAGVEQFYWPKWLCDEFAGASVHALNYPASIFEAWAKKEMNLHERASNFLEYFASVGLGTRPIVFVCHSLGGILVKEMLRVSNECSDDGWKSVAQQTRLVAFLATPHTGASLAGSIKCLVPRLASRFVELLSNDSGYLTSLNQSFRDIATSIGIRSISYYEKWKTKDIAIVVTPESADPGVGLCRPVPIDADHTTICKPKTKNDLIFVSLCRHIKASLQPEMSIVLNGNSMLDATNYADASEDDRRDLLQKLIDAGREHEYPMANSHQNKFAQKYYRLGLFTEAKQQCDALLSSVEQRFSTHVYDKICKRAPDDQIADALQTHVIDALSKKQDGQSVPSATSILQALYFLTEQCYIRWDAP